MARTLAAALAGAVAAVLLPLSIVSVWADRVVTDTDRYVETVAPLATDDKVKAAAVVVLQRETLRLVASTTGVDVPGLDRVVRGVVVRAVESPAFRTVWREANRAAHEQAVAVLQARDDAALDDSGQVTVDVGGLLDTIAENLARQGLVDPTRVPTIQASFAVMDAGQLAEARRAYRAIDALGFWLPVAWFVAVVLTLVLSRRRTAATARLAVASLVAVGLWALVLVFVRGEVTSDLSEREVALAVWDVVLASLWHAIGISAALLLAVAIVAGLLGRERRPVPATDDE